MRGVSGAALILVSAGMLTRVVTVITQMAIADSYGAGSVSDAFFATESVSELFLDIVVGGFVMAFIPLYSQCRADGGDAEARSFAWSFLVIGSGASVALAVVMVLGAPVLADLIAPGFDPQTRDLTISLTRIMAGAVAAIGVNAGLRGLLHAHRDFRYPELARLSYAGVLLLAAVTAGRVFGIQTLAWGMVAGALLMALIQAWRAVRLGLLRRPAVMDHPAARQAARRVPSILVAIAWTGILIAIDRVAASGLDEGSVATLNYAARIVLLPIGLLALPLKTAFFPTVSDLAARGQFDEIASSIQTGLRALTFLVVPACVGMAVLSEPMTRILFERGAFDSLATVATSEVIVLYALAVPAMSVISFVSGYYFAILDLRPLIVLNLGGWVLNLGASILLARSMGPAGVALGTAISATMVAGFMLFDLRSRHLPTLGGVDLARSIATTLIAAAGMGVVVHFTAGPIRSWLSEPDPFQQLLALAGSTLLGVVIYVAVAFVVSGREMAVLRTTITKSRGGRPR